MSKKILSIFGTRPEAIKMAPVIRALEQTEGLSSVVCVTGQHKEMLDDVLVQYDIRPERNLSLMKAGQKLDYITARAIEGLSQAIREIEPDAVLVHGDTTTTFCGALAAFYNQVPVGHVEAGLRTYNKFSPYPEEVNRCLTTQLSDWHFAPTEQAKENLLKENIPAEKIFVTGNTVIDAVRMDVAQDYVFTSPLLNGLKAETRPIILLTSHRRENLGEPMRDYFKGIRRFADENDALIVYPVHKNPLVQEAAREILGNHPNIILTDPVSAVEFHNFMALCKFLVTDSGGLQEEAMALNIPVLVLRDTTERPEAVAAGGVKLAGITGESVYAAMTELYRDEAVYAKMAAARNPYGDGTAAWKIAEILQKSLDKKLSK